MDRVATTAGLFPPGDAAEATRRRNVARQRDAGLDRVVSGQSDWENLLAHPLCVHEATDLGDPATYLDTEFTYRRPVVEDELTFDGMMAADLDAVGESEDLQAVVPGPYTLSHLADDDYYGDPEELLAGVVDFLAAEIRAFPPCETLFLLEPALVVDPPETGEDARASAAVDRVADAAECEVVAHVPGGALSEKLHAHLLDADVAAVGYDFVRDSSANLVLVNEYGTKDDIALGLVDGRTPAVESPETIHERVRWVVENTPPVTEFGTAYVTTNTELRSLSWEVAAGKLDALGRAVAFDLD